MCIVIILLDNISFQVQNTTQNTIPEVFFSVQAFKYTFSLNTKNTDLIQASSYSIFKA